MRFRFSSSLWWLDINGNLQNISFLGTVAIGSEPRASKSIRSLISFWTHLRPKPFWQKNFFKCWISLHKPVLVEFIFVALSNKHFTSPLLYVFGTALLAFIPRPVWVGFLYAPVSNPSGNLVILMSKNGKILSLSFSTVNLIRLCFELIYW